jgi:hypothetical protein
MDVAVDGNARTDTRDAAIVRPRGWYCVLQTVMSFQIGDTIGDYQIIGVLGRGGMGKVRVRNLISDRVERISPLCYCQR